MMIRSICGLLVLLAWNSAFAAEPIRALLITGGCCHDYENQKQILTQGLSQRAHLEWTVIHEGDSREHKVSVYSEPNWAMGYDVIVHNECFGSVEDADFVRGIVQAHLSGTPGVFIHCSLHSYRNSPAADTWRELLGVTSTSHEGQRPLTVVPVEPNHPIMTDFPEHWTTPNGELYKIEKVWPNCVPLAEAFGEDTQKNHVVIWTNTLGKTRVFGTSLGHHNETMLQDVWLDYVARGLLWSTDHLDDSGAPAAGYEGTGKAQIHLEPLQAVPDVS